MKTAEEYWNHHVAPAGLATFDCLSYDSRRHAVREMVAAIAADARADALAEAKPVPDPDEELAKAEYERFRNGHTVYPEWRIVDATFKELWLDYVKTLPPRPMRSPGQRLFEAVRKLGLGAFTDSYKRLLEEWPNKAENFESAAEELGIQPKE